MKTNRKRPARAVDSSVGKPAPKRPVKQTPPSESAKPSEGLYTRVDISVEDLFEQLSKLLAGALPPPFDHLDEHVQFGRQFHSSDGSADRDGNHALAVLIRLRQEAADTVERLLIFLDQTDGSEDLEDGGDLSLAEIRAKGGYDAPSTDDDELSGDENEPSLGFLEPHLTGQEHDWWFATYSNDVRQDVHQGDTDDREGDEHDGREPDVDDEPSLASGMEIDQTDWTHYDTRESTVDMEEECDDEGVDCSGIGDLDGLREQHAA